MTYIFSIIIYLSILVLVGFYKASSVKNSDDLYDSLISNLFFDNSYDSESTELYNNINIKNSKFNSLNLLILNFFESNVIQQREGVTI